MNIYYTIGEYALFVVVGVFSFLWWNLIKKNQKQNEQAERSLNHGIYALLAWVVFGCFTRLDYSELYGCMIHPEPFWESKNLLFSVISTLLLYAAIKTSNPQSKKHLLLIEATYWVLKLYIFKGAYTVGFGGAVIPSVVLYDFLSIFLRLYLIYFMVQSKVIKSLSIILLAFLFINIKVSFFCPPFIEEINDRLARIEGQKIRKEIIGVWEGEILMVKDLFEPADSFRQHVVVSIDQDSIYFFSVQHVGPSYHLKIEHGTWGYLSSSTKDFPSTEIFIKKCNRQYLQFELGIIFNKLQFDLWRKEND